MSEFHDLRTRAAKAIRQIWVMILYWMIGCCMNRLQPHTPPVEFGRMRVGVLTSFLEWKAQEGLR